MVYATRGLVEALLGFAEEREPSEVSIALVATPAGDLDDVALDPETPVLTDFYLPGAGGSVSAVFGMELGTPKSQARFVSHPTGPLGLARTDDLHGVVLVAVPPWGFDDVAAFGRHGDRLDLTLLDVEPPHESVSL